jgi:small subunit ribosomal protein S1
LKVGQTVKAQVIALDAEKRTIRLSMKQLVPTGLDEYLAEHKEGDIVTGRLTEVSAGSARVELGEGVIAACRIAKPAKQDKTAGKESVPASKVDLSSLGSMLQAKWKSGPSDDEVKADTLGTGQVRKFRIVRLDLESKKIELEVA